MAAQAERELGSLDILVNNAGVQFTASVQDFPTSDGKGSSRSTCPARSTPPRRRSPA